MTFAMRAVTYTRQNEVSKVYAAWTPCLEILETLKNLDAFQTYCREWTHSAVVQISHLLPFNAVENHIFSV